MTTMTGVGIVRDEKAECSNSRSSSVTPTRREVARTMVGATLGAILGPLLGRGQAEAAKNRRQKQNDGKNRKKNKHDAKRGKQRPRGNAPPPPPPPPAPLTGPRFCASDPTDLIGIAQIRRVAQTFLPPRGGQLTDAWVTLTENQAGLDLILDIRTVGPQGVPSNSVLASVQVVDIPRTAAAASGGRSPPRLTRRRQLRSASGTPWPLPGQTGRGSRSKASITKPAPMGHCSATTKPTGCFTWSPMIWSSLSASRPDEVRKDDGAARMEGPHWCSDRTIAETGTT